MKARVFTFYSDPGHAWLEVTKRELFELGISNLISGYSYMHRENVYLEEDCDAQNFIKIYEHRYGKIAIQEKNTFSGDCFIRRLQSYKS